MADMMKVFKLERDECDAVSLMAKEWISDPEIEELSGWSVKAIGQVVKNLPYVEPDGQMLVGDMVTFFWDNTELVNDRVMDSLERSFGCG
jgi:hypothetical protein